MAFELFGKPKKKPRKKVSKKKPSKKPKKNPRNGRPVVYGGRIYKQLIETNKVLRLIICLTRHNVEYCEA